MTENGTAAITIMTIDGVTTKEGTMIRDMIVEAMIAVIMTAITVATAIVMTTTTDRFKAI
jgi:hypothetical protein